MVLRPVKFVIGRVHGPNVASKIILLINVTLKITPPMWPYIMKAWCSIKGHVMWKVNDGTYAKF